MRRVAYGYTAVGFGLTVMVALPLAVPPLQLASETAVME